MLTIERLRNSSRARRAELLARINSATKFPSIPTLHVLGDRGVLNMEQTNVPEGVEEVELSEKIDGTNTRIILLPDGYLVGSREEIIYCSGDVCASNTMGIVDAVHELVDFKRLTREPVYPGCLTIYGETYGNKIGANWKRYATANAPRFGFRVFDACSLTAEEMVWLLEGAPPSEVAAWRENPANMGRFMSRPAFTALAKRAELRTVPVIGERKVADFVSPYASLMLNRLLSEIGKTRAGVGANGEGEGIVLRAANGMRWKARVEDYQRTLRALGTKE